MKTERGAIIIHVAFALIPLLLFGGIVLDQGTFYVARTQAQAAADAGALAGALELLANPTGVGNATVAAEYFAGTANAVWGQGVGAGNVAVKYPHPCPDRIDPNCIRVDVYRGLNRAGTVTGNPIATFMMSLVGVNQQRLRATATAQMAAGNKTECLKPWAISDKWTELSVPPNKVYNPGVDVYVPPYKGNEATMTGYTLADVGTILTLKEGDPHDVLNPSFYYEIGDASTYNEAIEGCVIEAEINGTIRTLPGNRKGPTKTATQNLILQDSGAMWDGTKVVGSAFPVSPRIVPIAMFSPQEYLDGDKQSGEFDLVLRNMMAFFVISVDNAGTVTGVICSEAALFRDGAGEISQTAAFLKFTRLVQ